VGYPNTLRLRTSGQLKLNDQHIVAIRYVSFATPQAERAWLGEIGIAEAIEFIEDTEVAVSVSFSASVFGR